MNLLHRSVIACTALAAATMLGLAPSTASAGNEDGKALAQRYCVKCHEIAPGVKPETPINPEAPSFVTIAGDPKTYPTKKLAAVLKGPHAKMEPHAFTAIERQNLIAYIKSQKQ